MSKPFPPREILTVSELNEQVRRLLEASFPEIWVEGEVSNLVQPGSGHIYFTLKDAQAQVRCALFRGRLKSLDYQATDGSHVLIRARVTLYNNRGDFQLIVQHIEDAGAGALRLAFETLKRQLHQQGLFEPSHKKALPPIPSRVGVITSPTGAAIRDIVSTLGRRFPAIPILVYPVRVQGAGAAEEIVDAIRLAGARLECDVLVLARGGGSLEDLWSFNDERVARAIYDSPIPVVSGIGHEIDVTISDLVADQRAATPTAAAELISPDHSELLHSVSRLQRRASFLMRQKIDYAWQRVDWLTKRFSSPRLGMTSAYQRLDLLYRRLLTAVRNHCHRNQVSKIRIIGRLRLCNPSTRISALLGNLRTLNQRNGRAAWHRLTDCRQQLSELNVRINSLNPLATLDRGYALVTHAETGRLISSSHHAKVGDRVEVQLARCRLGCTVDQSSKS